MGSMFGTYAQELNTAMPPGLSVLYVSFTAVTPSSGSTNNKAFEREWVNVSLGNERAVESISIASAGHFASSAFLLYISRAFAFMSVALMET